VASMAAAIEDGMRAGAGGDTWLRAGAAVEAPAAGPDVVSSDLDAARQP
jgi:hypothetical protein